MTNEWCTIRYVLPMECLHKQTAVCILIIIQSITDIAFPNHSMYICVRLLCGLPTQLFIGTITVCPPSVTLQCTCIFCDEVWSITLYDLVPEPLLFIFVTVGDRSTVVMDWTCEIIDNVCLKRIGNARSNTYRRHGQSSLQNAWIRPGSAFLCCYKEP